MNADFMEELIQWNHVLHEELLAHLKDLRKDPDIYGFALELPSDLGNMGIISAVGRESMLEGEQPGTRMALALRYGASDWEYIPNGKTFGNSCDALETLGEKYHQVFIDEDTCEYTEAGEAFRDALYAACLEVMRQCDQASEFGSIWFKLLTLSDDEHPIVSESFYRLNQGRALADAASLYPRV